MRLPLPRLISSLEQDAHFDGFAQADGVGHQNPLARLFERQQSGIELVRQVIDCRAVADPQIIPGWRRLPKQAFEIQAAIPELRRRVGHQFRLRGIEHRNALAFDF